MRCLRNSLKRKRCVMQKVYGVVVVHDDKEYSNTRMEIWSSYKPEKLFNMGCEAVLDVYKRQTTYPVSPGAETQDSPQALPWERGCVSGAGCRAGSIRKRSARRSARSGLPTRYRLLK